EAFYFPQGRKQAMSIKKRFSSKSTIASLIVRCAAHDTCTMSRRVPKIIRQAQPNFRSVTRSGNELPKRVIENSSRIDLARKYFVTDLPGAIIPATRLHNILDNLEQDHLLSEHALMYLQKQ